MQKIECEKAIRHLCHEWFKSIDSNGEVDQPSFHDFLSWLKENHSAYLHFNTSTSVEYDVESWFDQELKQAWRN